MDHLKYINIVLLVSFSIFVISCKKEEDKKIDTSEFILKDGFKIDLVAAEPLLDSPVAMQFDKQGRIWVVELPGYMRDIDGSDEEYPDGKIVILTDNDNDGEMDSRKIFLDSLIAPRTLAFAYNGLLYSENTNLWWASVENDQPTNRVLVDSLYVIGGNIEHQPNGLLYHVDNWIYSAKSNARYKMKNGEWIKEATIPRGQWGLTSDDDGRLFYNDNSNPLTGDYLMPNVLIDNKFQNIKHGQRQQIAKDRRVFPYQATAVNRGYEEGVLDSNDMLTNFTSSCGPLIYSGNNFPEEFYGNAFVCGPEVNLVKRYLLEKKGEKISATQAYEGGEFLVSKDETFRPVNLYNGLDGSMYIVDLRKGIIQHRAYMTSYLREKTLQRGLDKITGIGRIYKVSHKDAEINDKVAFRADVVIKLLNEENRTLRILAQQELINKNDKTIKGELLKLVNSSENSAGQINALWTLEGLNLLDSELLVQIINSTKNDNLINQALRIYSDQFAKEDKIVSTILKLANRNSENIDLYLCHLSGKVRNKKTEEVWKNLAEKYKDKPVYCEALISGTSGREDYFLNKIKKINNEPIYKMLEQTIENKKSNDVKAPKILTKKFLDNRTAGFQLYNTYCLSCHGYDGKGNADLAPPLYPSEYVTGPKERMIALVLQGLKGPVHVNGKKYDMNLVMPGVKNNPELTDKKIADIITFVKNSFTQKPEWLNEKSVTEIRENLEGNEEMFTEETLNKWVREKGYN